MRAVWMGIAVGLTVLAQPAQAKSLARPNIAQCPARPHTGEEGIARTRPLPVPAQLVGIVRSSRDNLAVLTLTGRTVCIDASWISLARNFTLSPDKRFLSFRWDGYEAWGHIIVDRTGNGQVTDTGVAPVYSPSRMRLAAADLSESAFGDLSAFAVWQIEPRGLRELAKIEQMPERMTDWRIDGWSGENCINLSALPFERATDSSRANARARRDRFVAMPGRAGWSVSPRPAGCPRR